MNNILSIIPIIISIIALILSFMTNINERNNVISNVVSADRIKWISDIRDLVHLFLESYIKGDSSEKLKIIKSKIDLYIIYDKDVYAKFEEKLNYCVKNSYTDKDYSELVMETQNMLNGVWIRIKNEVGIVNRDEKRINKISNR